MNQLCVFSVVFYIISLEYLYESWSEIFCIITVKMGLFIFQEEKIFIILWARRGSVALWTIHKYIICLSSRWSYKDRDLIWAQNPGFYFLNIVLNVSWMSCWEKTCVENSDWYYRLSIGMNQDSNKIKGRSFIDVELKGK